jgi:hypothetical protein
MNIIIIIIIIIIIVIIIRIIIVISTGFMLQGRTANLTSWRRKPSPST